MPELLDELPPADPRAVHSRRDLRRVNKLMGHADIIARVMSAGGARKELTLVELGGGDGTFLLEVAKRAAPRIGALKATLVDQQALLTSETRDALAALSWPVEMVRADVFEWLAHPTSGASDITIANLFLHHFERERLAALLQDASTQTRMFAACEPHRSAMALTAASLMGLIGCNSVTVHDARISVRAGFRGLELSAIWPAGHEWTIEERKAGRLTHGFVARRREDRG